MKYFLLLNKTPILKWGNIPDEIYFEGDLPKGYNLAISPSKPYIVLDIDIHDKINGFLNIPKDIYKELENNHFSYSSKGEGKHFWIKYIGSKELLNKTSGKGFDLRTDKGYVVWNHYLYKDIRECLHLIQESSNKLNNFLELNFAKNEKMG